MSDPLNDSHPVARNDNPDVGNGVLPASRPAGPARPVGPSPARRAVRVVGWPFRRLLLGLLHVYRKWISPGLPATCKYHPTCSSYAEQAIRRHGVGKGFLLAAARLGRCNPFSGGGVNPIPDAGRWRAPINTDGSLRAAGPEQGKLESESSASGGPSDRSGSVSRRVSDPRSASHMTTGGV